MAGPTPLCTSIAGPDAADSEPTTAGTVTSQDESHISHEADCEKQATGETSPLPSPVVAETYDPETLEAAPRRPTISESIKRAGTAFSQRLPPHWRPGYVNSGRHVQRIDDHPAGYARLGAFMNSDENFLMCRRYGLLHTRVMLYRQAELSRLERELFELDSEDAEDDPRALQDMRFFGRGEKGAYRQELIQKIDDKLEQYDSIVKRHREMTALPAASVRNYASLDNWVHNTAPLSPTDQELFKEDSDFAAIVDPKEAVALDGIIEDCLSIFPCRVTRLLFSSPEQRQITTDRRVRFYSKSRIDTFVRILITCLAVLLLVAPTAVLFTVRESNAWRIVVILLFTLGFSIALSIFTKAKRHEVFAATAAYIAVLVVFLGNLSTSGVVTGPG